jgi:hypothetical protein
MLGSPAADLLPMDVVARARQAVERMVQDLRGDEDFESAVIFVVPGSGPRVATLSECEDDDELTATIRRSAPRETAQVVLALTAWTLSGSQAEAASAEGVAPREHFARCEEAVVWSVTSGGAEIWRASLTRLDGRVFLGDWSCASLGSGTGPLIDALRDCLAA